MKSLLFLYTEGFRQIAPWYPSFHVKPEDVDSLTIESFLNMVDRSLTNGRRPCEDPYVMPEYNRGFFRKEGIAEAFKAVYINIFVPLYELLPDFMNEING